LFRQYLLSCFCFFTNERIALNRSKSGFGIASAILTSTRIWSVSAHGVWVSPNRACLASLIGCAHKKASDAHVRARHRHFRRHQQQHHRPNRIGDGLGSDEASVSVLVNAKSAVSAIGNGAWESATCATRVYARVTLPL